MHRFSPSLYFPSFSPLPLSSSPPSYHNDLLYPHPQCRCISNVEWVLPLSPFPLLPRPNTCIFPPFSPSSLSLNVFLSVSFSFLTFPSSSSPHLRVSHLFLLCLFNSLCTRRSGPLAAGTVWSSSIYLCQTALLPPEARTRTHTQTHTHTHACMHFLETYHNYNQTQRLPNPSPDLISHPAP